MEKLPLRGEQQPPYAQMLDGFWIREFSYGRLIISGSFNRLLYRNYDLVFEGVTFFNVPGEWTDITYDGDSPFCEGDPEEFTDLYGDFEFGNKKIFELNLYFQKGTGQPWYLHYFHIVADEGYALACTDGSCAPERFYTDPVAEYLSKVNRVDKL